MIGALRFKGLDKQTKKIGKIVKNIFLGINLCAQENCGIEMVLLSTENMRAWMVGVVLLVIFGHIFY